MEAADLIGETLDGRVELHELVAEGGYGAVFRGTQLSVGRSCAVKVVFPGSSADPSSVQRFCQEAEATSRLTNPHTVTVYDFGRDDDHAVFFLIMELLEGRSVRDAVDEDGPMSLERVADVVDQAASSLQEAHRADLVHRDVKPDHLMLVERGDDDCFVKVIDFGIAKAFRSDFDTDGNLTHPGRMVGTPGFMAPEQIRSDEVDGGVDQYALGLTTYLMAAGEVPFEGGAAMEMASRHLSERPPPLSSLVEGRRIPDAVDDVVGRAVSKRPEERFPDVRAFGDAFRRAVTGGEPSGTVRNEADLSTMDVDRSDRSRGRRLRLGVAMCVGLALLTGVAGGVLYLLRTGSAGRDELGGSFAVDEESGESRDALVRRESGEFAAEREEALAAGRSDDSPGESRDALAPWKAGESVAESRDALAPWKAGESVAESEEALAPRGARVTPAEAGPGRDDVTEAGGRSREASESGRSRDDDAGSEGSESPNRRATAPDSTTSSKGAELGRLEVRMIPWGTLYVDGREVERGTHVETGVSAGRHVLEVRQNGEPVAERTVRVADGETVDIEMVTR